MSLYAFTVVIVVAHRMALPFEGQEGVADYSLNIEKEIQAQKERSQKMIEARKRGPPM